MASNAALLDSSLGIASVAIVSNSRHSFFDSSFALLDLLESMAFDCYQMAQIQRYFLQFSEKYKIDHSVA
jgi:hypothetical protein